jgi:ATP-dependent Clp protease ATP-binding subunit ClpA
VRDESQWKNRETMHAQDLDSQPRLVTTSALMQTFDDAARWAALRKPHQVTSLHLLLGLVHATDSIAHAVLADNEISDANVWSAIDYWDPPRSGTHKAPRFIRLRRTPKWKTSARRVAAASATEAAQRGGKQIDTGDLLLALLHEPNSRAVRILDRAQLDPESLCQLVKLARGEINEGSATVDAPDFTKKRAVRPHWGPADAQ